MLGVSVRGLWLLRVSVGLLRLPVRRLILVLRWRRRHVGESPLLTVGW